MKHNFSPYCELCGKKRGREYSHEKCSRILQQKKAAEKPERITWEGQTGKGITPEQQNTSRYNRHTKKYLKGTVKWPD